MTVYFGVLAALGGVFTVYNSNLVTTKRSKDSLYWLAWLILLLVAGLRYRVGTDYPHYVANYRGYFESGFNLLEQSGGSLIAWISKLIYDDYATWFFIMAAITIIPCAIVIKRESIALGLSTVFFVLLCCWHISFNIVMQSVAMAILMLGYPFLQERQFIKWCVICAVAAFFHVTALVMIPVYFLVTPNITWKRIVLLICVGVGIALFHGQLFALMNMIDNKASESTESTFGSEQLSLLRVLVNCAPAILATLLLRRFDWNDKKFCLLYNMSLFNAVLNVGTMNSAYLNRFALYTIVYNALFIPYLVKPFKKEFRGLLWCGMIAAYTLYWAYDIYKNVDLVQFIWIFQR